MKFVKSVLTIGCGIVVGVVFLLGGALTTCSIAYEKGKEMKNEELQQIDIEDITQEHLRNYYYVRGRVVNKGDKPVNLVRVGVDFKDAQGNVVESNSTFAVSFDELNPGASKSFEIMTEYTTALENFESISTYIKPQ